MSLHGTKVQVIKGEPFVETLASLSKPCTVHQSSVICEHFIYKTGLGVLFKPWSTAVDRATALEQAEQGPPGRGQ